jgi:hypothetical protein
VLDEIIATVLEAGKIIGTVAGTAEQAKALTDKGVTIILNSVQGLIAGSAKAFIKDKIV